MKYLSYRPWQIESGTTAYGVEEIEGLLLARNGITEEKKAAYFKPDVSQLPDPFAFRDMELAVEILLETYRANGRVLVFGDYDCDGLTATALLLGFFGQIGLRADYLLPSRLADGYGLNDKLVDQILEDPPEVLLTVDNGSSAAAEVERLMVAGVRVIVTDHHLVSPDHARPLAFINPAWEEDTYPFPHLAGVGVALQLARAMRQRLGLSVDDPREFSLAALGTVADSMPMLADNRVIVALGLEAIREAGPLGLRLMLQEMRPEGEVSSEFLGFSLAPRINAAGRLDDMEPAMTLLLSQDPEEAREALAKVELLNQQRRELEQEAMAEAVAEISLQAASDKRDIIIVKGEDWHPGLLGLLAGRLAEQYQLPAICLAYCNGLWRGSARSSGNFPILEALRACEGQLESLGGHAQAAGLSLLTTNLPLFSQNLRAWAAEKRNQFLSEESHQIFAVLDHSSINEESFACLQRFEPFGNSNLRPSFLLQNLELSRIKRVGGGRHLSLAFRLEDGRQIQAIAFGMGHFAMLFAQGDLLDVEAELSLNHWNGQVALQLQVLDLRPNQAECEQALREARAGQAWEEGVGLSDIIASYTSEALANKSAAARPEQIFRLENGQIPKFWLYLEELMRDKAYLEFSLPLLTKAFRLATGEDISSFALGRILDILVEAKLISMFSLSPHNFRLEMTDGGQRPRLSQQPSWQRLEAEGAFY